MRLYDISQEVFSSAVYPGDPAPERRMLSSTAGGGLYNLTEFSMCAHNGTHIDAPFHFLGDGATVEQIPLTKTVGPAVVVDCRGDLDANGAEELLLRARALSAEGAKRILLKGGGTVLPSAAAVFAEAAVELIGSETQSVGDENAPMAVHLCLLRAETVLLEGIRLAGVPCGAYFLFAAPLLLSGSDGAPCRAILLDATPDC